MQSYSHLSQKERQSVEYFFNLKLSGRAIARKLKRSHKTILRELKRIKNYSWTGAEQQYRTLRFNKTGKIACSKALQKHIAKRLADKWSPEQIAGRLKLQKAPDQVCFKTIYSYANKDAKLRKLLPSYVAKPYYKNFKSVNKRLETLPSVHDRIEANEPRSWEADLVHFGNMVENVTTLFNRPSKLVRLIKNVNGKLETVLSGIKRYRKEIKLLTMDRGPEFLKPQWFYDNGIRPYYCDAMRPGQKGGCENTNGRLRRYLPKRTDISGIGQRDLDKIAYKMNNTPRKSLRFMTPFEAYRGI